jgi:serine acetyltransferase
MWLCSPGLLALTTQRLYFAASAVRRKHGFGPRFLLLRLAAATGKTLSVPLTHSLFAGDTPIEGGVYISNAGNVIVGASRIGSGTMIHHRVTIGRSLMDRGRPDIGKNVWIGPDCVLFGNITIGDGATILPQTVLTRSIPARAVIQGNPPRLVLSGFDNSPLRAQADPVAPMFEKGRLE